MDKNFVSFYETPHDVERMKDGNMFFSLQMRPMYIHYAMLYSNELYDDMMSVKKVFR